MDFASDNAAGASTAVLEALVAANAGFAPAYGADAWTARAERMLAEVFQKEIAVSLVATGTGANALALSAIAPPWGAIFCHGESHIIADECGAPEMMTAGAKLVGIDGPVGKITPERLAETLALYPRGLVKQVQPAALSLSQATECGTIYAQGEIAALAAMAHGAGCKVHMDGARFANALLTLGCSPADMTWKAGIDILSFGATKNGALACEAVIFFDPALAQDFAFRRKRAGHTLSKGRLLGAQMCAYLEKDHWLANAAHANAMAARLGEGLAAIPGCRMPWPRQANEVFAILPRTADAALRAAGAHYYDWGARSLPADEAPQEHECFVRLIPSFATLPGSVDRFLTIVRSAVAAA